MKRDGNTGTWKLILLAGIAGGAAEVLWVMFYSSITAVSGTTVARQVTATLWPAAAEWALAPAVGIFIHMALALALAAAFVPLLLRFASWHPGPGAMVTAATAALAVVWAVNFLILLPTINPDFVRLMPSGATLFSKLLFGLAMASFLQWRVSRSEAGMSQ